MSENIKTIRIEGMHCEHCKMTVEKALNGVQGITDVEVILDNKEAVIKYEKDISNDKIREVIEEAGFEVKEII